MGNPLGRLMGFGLPTFEIHTVTVADGDIVTFLRDVRRNGGTVLVSGPVGAGYQVTYQIPVV